jgi:Na+/H+-translocating membrane pyrophosphatase
MAPAFDIDTIVVGVPAIVTAALGLIVAGCFVYKISLCPSELDHRGDPERKRMSETITKLGRAISSGAYAFLLKEYLYLKICALCLFVLVSAAVNWRTGLWYVLFATAEALIVVLTFIFCTVH